VYNPLAIPLTGVVPDTGGAAPTRRGPLHDPTSILYVRTSDLQTVNPTCAGGATNPACAVTLKPNAPVEPIVLRANAGECLQVTLRNRLPATAPDLGTYTEWMRLVRREANDPDAGNGMTSFNANLVRPSSYVGLHTALLAYDINDADGSVVGANPETAVIAPGLSKTVQFYAGDIDINLTTMNLVATPAELPAAIISPADKMKQGMKGMVGAIVTQPAGAAWNDAGEVTFDHQVAAKPKTRLTRASASVTARGTTFRDFANVAIKGQGHRYADSRAVENVAAEGGILAEDTEDSGQMSINYGSEPMWFRFGLMPNVPFGNTPGGLGAVPNAGDAYSNALTTGGITFGEPSTPVFEAKPGVEARIRLLTPYAQMRASVFTVHGHVWQRN